MKRIHFESDMVFQSETGSVLLKSQGNELVLQFSDWDTVSSFFGTANRSFADIRQGLRMTKYLDQALVIAVGAKRAMRFEDGRITKWALVPSFQIFRRWLRSR